jgi:hypothetical protein
MNGYGPDNHAYILSKNTNFYLYHTNKNGSGFQPAPIQWALGGVSAEDKAAGA